MLFDTKRQNIRIVAAFQKTDDPSLTESFCELNYEIGQIREILGFQSQGPYRILSVAVKSRTDQD